MKIAGVFTHHYKAKNNEDITLYGKGEVRRTFTHVEDICLSILEVLEKQTVVNSITINSLSNSNVLIFCSNRATTAANVQPELQCSITKATTIDTNFLIRAKDGPADSTPDFISNIGSRLFANQNGEHKKQ